ncbi:Ig-like domain repeat protein, partial [Nocardia tengchongensis]
MHAFDPNDYRKRVLAAVERRGGLAESDAFELYDIPLADAPRLSDDEVAARVAEVWAFWQKLRDHPKFRVLAGLLVDAHSDLSGPLLHTGSRLHEADRVRQLRDRRDAERFEMLDAAIGRLVQRHNGIPAGKIPGLEDIGRLGGLTVAEVAERVRRHRIIDDAPAAPPPPATPALSSDLRRQIRSL